MILINAKKLIAVVTAVCFVETSVIAPAVHAMTVPPVSQTAVQSALDGMLIPSTAGRVTGGKYFGSGTVVVSIQDLHCHAEVQRNISKILEELDAKYKLKTVYLEGGYGDIDTSWLGNIKDPTYRQELVEAMVDSGRLTGAEYYAVVKDRPGLLKGLEDEQLHRGNVVRLGKILEKKPYFEGKVKELDKDMAFLEAKYFSSRNRRFNKAIEKYRTGGMPAEKYYALLGKYVETINAHRDAGSAGYRIRLENYPNIRRYVELLQTGKRLPYKRIAQQLQKFVGELKERLPYSSYRYLLEKTGNFSQQDKLYVALSRLSREYHFDLSRYPDLERFFAYVDKGQEVNPVEMIREEKHLVEEIRMGFAGDISELEVSFLVDFYGYFKDYLFNRLAADDYRYFTERFGKFKEIWAKYTYVDRLFELEKEFPLLDEYYRVNDERNEVFLCRMVGEEADKESVQPADREIDEQIAMTEQLMESASKIVVVVAGGFHTEGLEALLASRRISYLSITPNVTQGTAQSSFLYEQLAGHQALLTADTQNKAAALVSRLLVPLHKGQNPTRELAKSLTNVDFRHSDALGLTIASSQPGMERFRVAAEAEWRKLAQTGGRLDKEDIDQLLRAMGQTDMSSKVYDKQIILLLKTPERRRQLTVARIDRRTGKFLDDKTATSAVQPEGGQELDIAGISRQVETLAEWVFNQPSELQINHLFPQMVTVLLWMAEQDLLTGNGPVYELADPEKLVALTKRFSSNSSTENIGKLPDAVQRAMNTLFENKAALQQLIKEEKSGLLQALLVAGDALGAIPDRDTAIAAEQQEHSLHSIEQQQITPEETASVTYSATRSGTKPRETGSEEGHHGGGYPGETTTDESAGNETAEQAFDPVTKIDELFSIVHNKDVLIENRVAAVQRLMELQTYFTSLHDVIVKRTGPDTRLRFLLANPRASSMRGYVQWILTMTDPAFDDYQQLIRTVLQKFDEADRQMPEERRYESDFEDHYREMIALLEYVLPGSLNKIISLLNAVIAKKNPPAGVLRLLDGKWTAIMDPEMALVLHDAYENMEKMVRKNKGSEQSIKIDIDRFSKIIDLASGFVSLEAGKKMEETVKAYTTATRDGNKAVEDLRDLLSVQLLQLFAGSFGVKKADIKQEAYTKIYLPLVEKLLVARNNIPLDKLHWFDGLIKAMLEDRFWEFIEDIDQHDAIGKTIALHNGKVRKSMVKKGIDVTRYLGHEAGSRFASNTISYKGKTFTLRPILRDPGRDLFMGDFVDNCIAMGSWTFPEGMVERLIDEGINAIEVLDDKEHPMAGAWLYIAQDGSLVIQNLEIAAEYETRETVEFMGDAMISYASAFSEYVNAKRLLLGIPGHGKFHEEKYDGKDSYVDALYKKSSIRRIYFGMGKIGGYLENIDYYLDSTLRLAAYQVGDNRWRGRNIVASLLDELFKAPFRELSRFSALLALAMTDTDEYKKEVAKFLAEHGYEGEKYAGMPSDIDRILKPVMIVSRSWIGIRVPALTKIALVLAHAGYNLTHGSHTRHQRPLTLPADGGNYRPTDRDSLLSAIQMLHNKRTDKQSIGRKTIAMQYLLKLYEYEDLSPDAALLISQEADRNPRLAFLLFYTLVHDSPDYIERILRMDDREFGDYQSTVEELKRLFNEANQNAPASGKAAVDFEYEYVPVALLMDHVAPKTISNMTGLLKKTIKEGKYNPKMVTRTIDRKRQALINNKSMTFLQNAFSKIITIIDQNRGTGSTVKISGDRFYKIIDMTNAIESLESDNDINDMIDSFDSKSPYVNDVIDAFYEQLTERFLKLLAKDIGLDAFKPDRKIIDKLYLPYLGRLTFAMKVIHDYEDADKLALFRGVVKAMLEDRFWEFIEDDQQSDTTGREIARHNIQVRQLMEAKKIDVDRYLGKEAEYRFSPEDFDLYGRQFTMRSILRNPGHDLFIGDFTENCLAMGSDLYPHAMVERLIDEGMQTIEVLDDKGRAVAALWLYLDEDGSLVIQNIEIASRYDTAGAREYIADHMINYTLAFSRHIKAKRLLIGAPGHGKFNDGDGNYVETLYKSNQIFRIAYGLGKIGGYVKDIPYYLDSAGKPEAYLVPAPVETGRYFDTLSRARPVIETRLQESVRMQGPLKEQDVSIVLASLGIEHIEVRSRENRLILIEKEKIWETELAEVDSMTGQFIDSAEETVHDAGNIRKAAILPENVAPYYLRALRMSVALEERGAPRTLAIALARNVSLLRLSLKETSPLLRDPELFDRRHGKADPARTAMINRVWHAAVIGILGTSGALLLLGVLPVLPVWLLAPWITSFAASLLWHIRYDRNASIPTIIVIKNKFSDEVALPAQGGYAVVQIVRELDGEVGDEALEDLGFPDIEGKGTVRGGVIDGVLTIRIAESDAAGFTAAANDIVDRLHVLDNIDADALVINAADREIYNAPSGVRYLTVGEIAARMEKEGYRQLQRLWGRYAQKHAFQENIGESWSATKKKVTLSLMHYLSMGILLFLADIILAAVLETVVDRFHVGVLEMMLSLLQSQASILIDTISGLILLLPFLERKIPEQELAVLLRVKDFRRQFERSLHAVTTMKKLRAAGVNDLWDNPSYRRVYYMKDKEVEFREDEENYLTIARKILNALLGYRDAKGDYYQGDLTGSLGKGVKSVKALVKELPELRALANSPEIVRAKTQELLRVIRTGDPETGGRSVEAMEKELFGLMALADSAEISRTRTLELLKAIQPHVKPDSKGMALLTEAIEAIENESYLSKEDVEVSVWKRDPWVDLSYAKEFHCCAYLGGLNELAGFQYINNKGISSLDLKTRAGGKIRKVRVIMGAGIYTGADGRKKSVLLIDSVEGTTSMERAVIKKAIEDYGKASGFSKVLYNKDVFSTVSQRFIRYVRESGAILEEMKVRLPYSGDLQYLEMFKFPSIFRKLPQQLLQVLRWLMIFNYIHSRGKIAGYVVDLEAGNAGQTGENAFAATMPDTTVVPEVVPVTGKSLAAERAGTASVTSYAGRTRKAAIQPENVAPYYLRALRISGSLERAGLAHVPAMIVAQAVSLLVNSWKETDPLLQYPELFDRGHGTANPSRTKMIHRVWWAAWLGVLDLAGAAVILMVLSPSIAALVAVPGILSFAISLLLHARYDMRAEVPTAIVIKNRPSDTTGMTQGKEYTTIQIVRGLDDEVQKELLHNTGFKIDGNYVWAGMIDGTLTLLVEGVSAGRFDQSMDSVVETLKGFANVRGNVRAIAILHSLDADLSSMESAVIYDFTGSMVKVRAGRDEALEFSREKLPPYGALRNVLRAHNFALAREVAIESKWSAGYRKLEVLNGSIVLKQKDIEDNAHIEGIAELQNKGAKIYVKYEGNSQAELEALLKTYHLDGALVVRGNGTDGAEVNSEEIVQNVGSSTDLVLSGPNVKGERGRGYAELDLEDPIDIQRIEDRKIQPGTVVKVKVDDNSIRKIEQLNKLPGNVILVFEGAEYRELSRITGRDIMELNLFGVNLLAVLRILPQTAEEKQTYEERMAFSLEFGDDVKPAETLKGDKETVAGYVTHILKGEYQEVKDPSLALFIESAAAYDRTAADPQSFRAAAAARLVLAAQNKRYGLESGEKEDTLVEMMSKLQELGEDFTAEAPAELVRLGTVSGPEFEQLKVRAREDKADAARAVIELLALYGEQKIVFRAKDLRFEQLNVNAVRSVLEAA